MFRKSILQLHLKDKLFFLLVAILAIGGIFFGVKAGISYLSGSIKGHKEELNETKSQFSQLEATYGPELQKALNTVKQLQDGLFAQLNKLGLWQGISLIIGLLYHKEAITWLIRILKGN